MAERLRFPAADAAKLEAQLPSKQAIALATSESRPFVTLTFATSLDSSLSLAPGTRTRLSGSESKAMTHYLRSRHDAICVGVGTVVADDPALNCRIEGVGLKKQPRPIIIDPSCRWEVSARSKVLEVARAGLGLAPYVITSRWDVDPARRGLLEQHGGKFITVQMDVAGSGRFAWRDILAALHREGLGSVMIEGGGQVINSLTVERYKLMKKGDLESAKKLASAAPLPAAGASSSTSNGKSAAQELSLIDFDAEVPSNGTSSAQPSQSGGSVENDLLGLSIGETENFGQGGALSLGFGSNTNIPGPALLSSLNEGQTAKSATASPAAPPPGFANLSSFTSPSASQSGTPQPQANYIFNKPPPPAPASDPFAALGASFSPPQSTTPVPAAAPTSNDDDEWSFSSALPPAPAPTQPREHKAVISDGGVKIEMLANRTTANSSAVNIVFAFSNTTAQPVTELHYQVAVTKGYEIKISPQTGVALEPKQSRGVTQTVEVNHAGDRSRKVEALKLRFRVSYKVGGALRNEAGAVSEFSIA
ncbi:2 like protein [Verticillium longisporum]|nr:2 like protein [Verticillium longisporum]